jgi:hypothetical protein
MVDKILRKYFVYNGKSSVYCCNDGTLVIGLENLDNANESFVYALLRMPTLRKYCIRIIMINAHDQIMYSTVMDDTTFSTECKIHL